MKVCVLIPDRGDRPEFLANCLRMMNVQTLKPDHIELVDYAPTSDRCDITQRYRVGYSGIDRGFDVIAFIENDDYYAPDYLETMVTAWAFAGKPAIFGTNYTVYYHVRIGAYFTMYHAQRSSAMSTLIRPGLDIDWPVDHEPFTDMWLWERLKGKTFNPGRHIAIGMKHGVGMCGGRSHIDKLERYRFPDNGFLKSNLDLDSYNFYSKFYEPDFVNTSKSRAREKSI